MIKITINVIIPKSLAQDHEQALRQVNYQAATF